MVKQWEIVRETQSDSAQDTWAIQSSGYHLQALHLLPWKVFPSAVPFLLGREIMICASYTHTNLLETSSEDDVSSGCKLWYLQRLQMFKHPYEVFQLQWEVNFLVLRIQLELGDCWKFDGILIESGKVPPNMEWLLQILIFFNKPNEKWEPISVSFSWSYVACKKSSDECLVEWNLQVWSGKHRSFSPRVISRGRTRIWVQHTHTWLGRLLA